MNIGCRIDILDPSKIERTIVRNSLKACGRDENHN